MGRRWAAGVPHHCTVSRCILLGPLHPGCSAAHWRLRTQVCLLASAGETAQGSCTAVCLYARSQLCWLQAKEMWASLHCLLSNYSVVSKAPMVLDNDSQQLFQQKGAEANPTMCQELVNNTRVCLLHLPQAEQVVMAGLPWLRNYHLSPKDIVVTGFELPSSQNASRYVTTCTSSAANPQLECSCSHCGHQCT